MPGSFPAVWGVIMAAGLYSFSTASGNPQFIDSTGTPETVDITPLLTTEVSIVLGSDPELLANRQNLTDYEIPGVEETRTFDLEIADVSDMNADLRAICLGTVPTGWTLPIKFKFTQTVDSVVKTITLPVKLGKRNVGLKRGDSYTVTCVYRSDATTPIVMS